MLKRAQKFNPFLLMGSLMVVVLLMVAACGGDAATPAPAPAAPAIDEAALSNLVKSAVEEASTDQPEGLTAEQVEKIVDSAVMSIDIPEGESLSASQVQTIVGEAIAAIPTPENLTAEDVQGIIAMVMGGQSEGLTAMQVQDIVNNALMAAEDPDALTAMKVQEIVAMALADAAMEEAKQKGTITFATLDWSSAQIQSALAQYIVKHGYGYPVGERAGSTIPLFQGLLGGDIDVTLEIWLPNQNNVWLPALDEGAVIPVGNSLNEQWQSAFVIPTYLAEKYPDLQSVEDLRDFVGQDKFPEEDGKIILWTCPGSWGCHETNNRQVAAYGLEDVILLKPAEGGGPLFASLQGAYEKEEAWLGYLWAPSVPANTLDLTRLGEPAACEDNHPEDTNCAYGVGPVRIAVHPTMVQRAPDVVEMLRQWSFDDAQIGEVLQYRSQTEASAEEAAIWFLTNREAIWTSWVPSDVAGRVKAALAAQAS
jgi:glycine betaine/proline transport system substrate-binding protein